MMTVLTNELSGHAATNCSITVQQPKCITRNKLAAYREAAHSGKPAAVANYTLDAHSHSKASRFRVDLTLESVALLLQNARCENLWITYDNNSSQ